MHTFTKISVGSQTDLEALLAYVKSLQAKLEESVVEEEEAPLALSGSMRSESQETQTFQAEQVAESSQVTASLSDLLVDSGNSTPTNNPRHFQVRERDRDL